MAASNSAPLTVPGYRMIEVIGRGGMGVVYRARDERFGRDVAIKLLGEKIASDSFAAARFRNEARITGQLQHPGIPPAHDLGELSHGAPFLVMKLVKGDTLQTMLAQRTSPADELGRYIAVFEQICQAVGYAHAHNVIHRDLKPSNVMVGKFGEVQIMDWGLAKLLNLTSTPEDSSEDTETHDNDFYFQPVAEGSLAETSAHQPFENTDSTAAYIDGLMDTRSAGSSMTRTGSILGTLAYMPPEQAAGEIRKLNPQSDVFALGAILCQILTGQPPYSGALPRDVALQAYRGDLHGTFERLDACGAEPELVALARKCLAKDQSDRPNDGQTVADEIARIRFQAENRARAAELEQSQALVRTAELERRLAMAKIELREYADAADLLQLAITHQTRAFSTAPERQVFRKFLKNHYLNLLEVGQLADNPDFQKQAEAGLAELAASDPAIMALNKRLSAIESGDSVTSVSEQLALAQRAYELHKFALAAKLFGEALSADASLQEDREQQYAYNAACCAALAWAESETNSLDASAREPLHQQAFHWLTIELEQWQRYLDNEPKSQSRQVTLAALDHWQKDSDLACLRDLEKLKSLSESEQVKWLDFWSRVKNTVKSLQANAIPP